MTAITRYAIKEKGKQRKVFVINKTHVVLKSGIYTPTEKYPVWGSEHECVGTVISISTTGLITIKWENGKNSTFRQDNLKIVNRDSYTANDIKKNPNIAFRIKNEQKR